MKKSFKNQPFEVVTIAGYRYTVNLSEVYGWFTNIWWWTFLAIAMVFLVTVMPHNQVYGLDWGERLFFWPTMTALYLLIYIICIRFGAQFASRRSGSYYYTPIGMMIATIVTTYLSAFYLGYIHNSPPEIGLFKLIEVVFNMLWASIFEAFHFAFNVPRLRKKQNEKAHKWEKFD